MEDKWKIGNYLNKGRASTHLTKHRWPKQGQIMPLKKKLDQPLEVGVFT